MTVEIGASARSARATDADVRLASLFSQVEAPGIALAAVGGYGRKRLSPGSDLDFTLVHRGNLREAELKKIVEGILYPLWDSNTAVDHSVRNIEESLQMAKKDLKVALGLLDARHVAGDESLSLELASRGAQEWRNAGAERLKELRNSYQERSQKYGELAFLLEPDLKEARGGLRDVVLMRAIAATWITDLPHEHLEDAELLLLNVRDALHITSGRDKDVLLMQEQDRVAELLELSDADELMKLVAQSARVIDYASELTWHRVEQSANTKRRSFLARTRPVKPEPVGDGVATFQGEVVLEFHAPVDSDPLLGLRAAAYAAQSGLPLSPYACQRLIHFAPPMPQLWPREARELLVTFLGAGPAMVRVWEALEQSGLIERYIPSWTRLRNLPQRNSLHRHTVDRHMVETAVQAASLTRMVHRPDLLLIAALLHDLGKGIEGDHSIVGAEMVGQVVTNLGWSGHDVEIVKLLVRHHLLLPILATRRDIEDRATVDSVVEVLPEDAAAFLELLHALSIADGTATGSAGWSKWKAGLVQTLVDRVRDRIAGVELPLPPRLTLDQVSAATSGNVRVIVRANESNYDIEVIAPDSAGLLAIVAGVMTLAKFDVRSARTITHERSAVMNWLVAPGRGGGAPDGERLRADLLRALDSSHDIAAQVKKKAAAYAVINVPAPLVRVLHDAATDATVLEVRSHDRVG
ncbi:MAG: [protein-PII] uridylyltransferase, partial [Actinobacteria bacterium]